MRENASPAEVARFLAFVDTMAEPQRARVREVWARVSARPGLSPAPAAYEDLNHEHPPGSISLIWSHDAGTTDLDIMPNGQFEWFWADGEQYGGTSFDFENEFPEALLEHIPTY